MIITFDHVLDSVVIVRPPCGGISVLTLCLL